MRSIILVTSFLVSCCMMASCGLAASAWCAKLDECSEDENEDDDSDDGEDDVAVCAATQQGLLDGLRANVEPECDALASALEGLQSCQAALDCDDLNDDDDGGKCDDEHDAIDDACDDIIDNEIDCETLLALQCGLGGG